MEEQNKNKMSFDNIKLLANLVANNGSFSQLQNDIKNTKLKFDAITKAAKQKEKELFIEIEQKEQQILLQQANIEAQAQKQAEIKEVVSQDTTIAQHVQVEPTIENKQPESQKVDTVIKPQDNNNQNNYNQQNKPNQNTNSNYQNNYNQQNRSYQNNGANQQNRPYQNNGYNQQNRPYQNQNGQNRPYQNTNSNYQNNGYNQQNRPYQNNGANQQNRPYQNQNGQNRPYQNSNSNYQNNGYNQQNRTGNNNFRPQQGPFNRPQGQRPFGTQNGQFNKSPFAQKLTKPLERIPVPTAPTRDFSKKKTTVKQFEDKHVMNKRTLLRRGLVEERNIEERMLSRKLKTKKKENPVVEIKEQGPAILTTDNITVKLLSETIGKPVSEIIKKFMLLGMMVTINSAIDYQTAELIASEMGIEIKQNLAKTSEEKLLDVKQTIRSYSEDEAITRPPIVAVMGHVDHGKTSLLDYIRRAKVTLGEAGGITQHIGAYMVNKNNKMITFIDTPGHEAFTQMRARGAMVTDIAILVVAADDGIMPQTVEAINHIKAAKVPMIVAINKMDKPGADPDKIMQQLTEYNVVPEAWGGDAIIVKLSAKTGEGIDKLLEMILLVAEMCELKANPNTPAIGTIMEAHLDKGRGAMASVIVKDGTLNVGDIIVSGLSICKVKAMIDENSKNVAKATPGMPVSVVGFSEVPNAGDEFTVVDEKLSKEIVSERRAKIKTDLTKNSSANSLEDMLNKDKDNAKVLNIVLKTDVNGSLEAIKASLLKLNNDKVVVNILHGGVGAISESDVILANASNAFVLGFDVRIDSKAKTVADRLKVDTKFFKVIYELLDFIEAKMKGMKDPVYREEILGHAEVMMVFKLSSSGLVAGSMVKDGKIVRNEHARIMRNGEEIADTMIPTIKIQKDDAKEVAKGFECGIKLNYNDFKVGDMIECYKLVQVED